MTEEYSPDNSPGQNGHSRRKFMVAGAATWASVSLAGCMGADDNGDDNGDDTGGNNNPTPNYVVTDEIIAGSEGIPEGTGGFASACAPQRTFVPGMQPVFDIGIWDPETGNAVGDDVVDEAVVELDTGDTIDLSWDDEDGYWGGSWIIPDDLDAGSVGYTVEVTNDGEFRNVGVLESEFQVIELEDPAANYVVTTDLKTGSSNIPEDGAGGFASACSPQNTFAQGMMVGWDVGIYNGSTGEIVGDDVVDEAIITTDRGGEFELSWDDEDEYWSAVWHMPEDEEPGTVTYTVEVSNGDEFHRVGIQEDSFPIIEYDQ